MTVITLYGCPKACSLVSHIALEMIGAPFSYVALSPSRGPSTPNDCLPAVKRVLDRERGYLPCFDRLDVSST